jgi:hypothetical protein
MQQFCVPMLPHMLCEQLCSLNPGVDRYAFSTIFRYLFLFFWIVTLDCGWFDSLAQNGQRRPRAQLLVRLVLSRIR